MNDQTQKPTINAPTVPPVVNPAPVTPAASAPVPSPASVPTPPAVASQPEAKKLNIPKLDPKEILPAIKKMPLKFKIMAGFVALLLVLLILASFTKKGKSVVQQIVAPSASPIPTTTPVGEVLIPTQYASDADVMKIEENLKAFDSKLSGTTLTENSLRVPSLDYEITFKK